jgi:uncharacterized protein YndB with AHSA1/START domain
VTTFDWSAAMDFFVEQTIHAAPEDVARIMFDPEREGEWTAKGARAEKLTPGPLAVGSRVRHEAGVHGWKVSFVTEVKAFDPDRRLEMEVVDSPDHGRIIYQVAPTAGGAIAAIHVHDEGLARMPHSVWARKQQALENLSHLAAAVIHSHA